MKGEDLIDQAQEIDFAAMVADYRAMLALAPTVTRNECGDGRAAGGSPVYSSGISKAEQHTSRRWWTSTSCCSSEQCISSERMIGYLSQSAQR